MVWTACVRGGAGVLKVMKGSRDASSGVPELRWIQSPARGTALVTCSNRAARGRGAQQPPALVPSNGPSPPAGRFHRAKGDLRRRPARGGWHDEGMTQFCVLCQSPPQSTGVGQRLIDKKGGVRVSRVRRTNTSNGRRRLREKGGPIEWSQVGGQERGHVPSRRPCRSTAHVGGALKVLRGGRRRRP